VKSRLVPPLTGEEAAGLYTAFLGDLADMLAAGGNAWRWWVYSTEPGEQKAMWPVEAALPEDWRPQRGADLGERMHGALAELLAEGAAAVLIGSDHPTLPSAFLEEAFRLLADADVVLGPSLDGGYYLVGTRRPQPRLFEGIAWSTPGVLDQTLERIRGASLRAAFLPPWYDVDTAADLRFLRTHLLAAELGADLPPCPRTRSWLAHHPAGTVPREKERP
jgi:rSAM/selenodomain-associated transferase 1